MRDKGTAEIKTLAQWASARARLRHSQEHVDQVLPEMSEATEQFDAGQREMIRELTERLSEIQSPGNRLL
jgi:hypothetical protein